MKYQIDAISYFISIVCIFVIILNAFLIYFIRPNFLWRQQTEEKSIEIKSVLIILCLFMASFFLGIITYIMKLYNGFVM